MGDSKIGICTYGSSVHPYTVDVICRRPVSEAYMSVDDEGQILVYFAKHVREYSESLLSRPDLREIDTRYSSQLSTRPPRCSPPSSNIGASSVTLTKVFAGIDSIYCIRSPGILYSCT